MLKRNPSQDILYQVNPEFDISSVFQLCDKICVKNKYKSSYQPRMHSDLLVGGCEG